MLSLLHTARHLSVFAVLSVLAARAPSQSSQETGTQPPNILLILADDLGAEQVGCYSSMPGVTPVTWTPNIDLLARAGARFTSCWANPVCSPSRAAIHTGKYALGASGHHVAGTVEWNGGTDCPPTAGAPRGALSLSELTLPEHLTANTSYAHALIGKWHLDYPVKGPWGPVAHGWSYFAGVLKGGVRSYYSWHRYQATTASPTPACVPESVVTTYATQQIVNDALSWIATVPQNRPWFCCVSFTAPHAPFELPPSALAPTTIPSGCLPAANCDPQQIYRAMVEALDTEIGRLLGTLGERLTNTIVIVTSDNGTPPEIVSGPFVDNGCPKGKGTPYQGGVRVPLIVFGPDVPIGIVRGQLVHLRDLFNTVADYSRAGVVSSLPSQSLRPYLRSNPASGPTAIFTTLGGALLDGFCPGSPAGGCPACRSAVGVLHDPGFYAVQDTNGFKLVQYLVPAQGCFPMSTPGCPGTCYPRSGPNGSCGELMFDLTNDPFEVSPLDVTNPAYAAEYASLLAQLQAFACGGPCSQWPPLK